MMMAMCLTKKLGNGLEVPCESTFYDNVIQLLQDDRLTLVCIVHKCSFHDLQSHLLPQIFQTSVIPFPSCQGFLLGPFSKDNVMQHSQTYVIHLRSVTTRHSDTEQNINVLFQYCIRTSCSPVASHCEPVSTFCHLSIQFTHRCSHDDVEHQRDCIIFFLP